MTVTDASGHIRTFRAAVFTAQSWLLLSKIDCDEALFPIDHWTAIERTHYMASSKVFVPVDRPFWLDRDPVTGRDTMSMTLTDRMPRGTYLLGADPCKPAVICLSYTWADDSLKWLPLSVSERVEVMLQSLREIYPGVDVRKHLGDPVTVSWEAEPHFMGAFRTTCPSATAGCSSPATTFPGPRAGPRAPCRRRSTRRGACSGTSAASRRRPTPVPVACSTTWRRSNCPPDPAARQPVPGGSQPMVSPGATPPKIGRSR